MQKVLLALGTILVAAGCVHESDLACTDRSRARTQEKLYGAWTTREIDTSYPEWGDAAGYQLFVYEDKRLDTVQSNLPGNLVVAELIVLRKDRTFELMHDTQPVFGTGDMLYLGPIGSCYQFKYWLSGSSLKLDLQSRDGGSLKLYFVKTSTEPGEPRFPEISKRWR